MIIGVIPPSTGLGPTALGATRRRNTLLGGVLGAVGVTLLGVTLLGGGAGAVLLGGTRRPRKRR